MGVSHDNKNTDIERIAKAKQRNVFFLKQPKFRIQLVNKVTQLMYMYLPTYVPTVPKIYVRTYST